MRPKSQQQLVRDWTSRKNGRSLISQKSQMLSLFSLPQVVGIFGMVGAVFLATLQAADQSLPAQSLPLIIAPQPRLGFTRMPGSTTDILFTNELSNARSITNRNLLSVSGVAAGDVDGDGLADLYFCGLDNN